MTVEKVYMVFYRDHRGEHLRGVHASPEAALEWVRDYCLGTGRMWLDADETNYLIREEAVEHGQF